MNNSTCKEKTKKKIIIEEPTITAIAHICNYIAYC